MVVISVFLFLYSCAHLSVYMCLCVNAGGCERALKWPLDVKSFCLSFQLITPSANQNRSFWSSRENSCEKNKKTKESQQCVFGDCLPATVS